MAWNFTETTKTTVQVGSGLELISEFGALLAAGIDEAKSAPEAKTPIQGQKYYSTKNVDKNNYVYQGMNGLDDLIQINSDADNLPITKSSVGFQHTISNYVMRQSTGIARELLETDRYGVIGQRSRMLISTAKKTLERILADGFNRGFGESTGITSAQANLAMLAEDGLAFFSGSRPQPRKAAGSWSNLEASTSLTADAIATARLNFNKYQNGNGDLDPQMLTKVIVSPDQEDTMREISGTTLKVDTSLNTTNIVSGVDYEVWHWLSADKVIFKGDCENELEFHIRVNPSIMVFEAGENPDVLKTRLRMAVGTGLGRPGLYRGADLT